MKEIDPTGIAAALPDLSSVQAVARDGDFAGCPFRVSWAGNWVANAGWGMIHLDETSRENIILDSDVGEITLHRPMATNSHTDGGVTGVATSVELRARTAPPGTPLLFRTLVKTDENLWTRLYFPCSFRDIRAGGGARAHLPLRTDQVEVDVFFIKEGPFVVLEMAIESDSTDDQEKAKTAIGAARQMLTYLTGTPLDADGCDTISVAETNQLISARWYQGRRREGHIYHPIPCSWAEWTSAQRDLGLPQEMPSQGALKPDVISKCLAAFIDQPGLVTPTEYLVRFPEAPVEMRGAFLSVALESLTDHLQKVGILDSVTLLPLEVWEPLRAQLVGVAEAAWDGWEESQRSALRNRINGLNSATNSQKLNLPFEKLGVEISRDEKRAIDRRNKLLHQGRLLDPDRVAGDPDAWRTAYEVEMRMYTAINKLFLKHLGYEGPVIDWGNTSMETGEQTYVVL